MKKIIVLVDQLHSHGGIERLVALKANYWTDVSGYEVTIVSTEQDKKPIVYKLSDKVKFQDLAINYARNKSYFSFENSIRFIKNIFAVLQVIQREKPDFVLVASHIPITYIVPFIVWNAKTIKEFHFTKFFRKHVGIKNRILTYVESKYDYLVVLSKEESQFYFSDNVVVIPNPIEKVVVSSGFNYSENQNIALAIGRFAPVKRLDRMVEIWSKFIKVNPNWKLFIFGTTGNDYFKEIEKWVIENKMQDFIFFKGQSDTIYNEMAKAKLVLMTSEQECFPMVILEANAIGIPVISFDSPTGPRNIIHHNSDGIIVALNNNDSFVAELLRFDRDKKFQLKLSHNAKANAENYEIDRVMNSWNELIFAKND